MGVLYSSKGNLLALDYFNAALDYSPIDMIFTIKLMFYQSLETLMKQSKPMNVP